MKIRKLILHNIASIEDACIDFTQNELANAPLFLITGETGSGKTTLLDGICLALYAKAPRMTRMPSQEKYTINTTDRNQQRQDEVNINDNSQLMRRNTGECFAELHFIGNDDQLYVASWHLQRANRRATGKIQQQKRTLLNMKTRETLTKKDDIEQVMTQAVGLSYEQFVRTTLLAQGEFTRFLQSKSDEKSEILEKLTGTEIYSEIGRRIANKSKAAEEHYERLKMTTSHIRLLSAEEKEKLTTSLQKNLKESQSLEKEIQQAAHKVEWLKADESLKKKQKQTNEQLTNTVSHIHSEVFNEQVRLLNEYTAAQQAIGWLSDLKDSQAKQLTLSKQQNILENKLNATEEAVRKAQKEMKTTEEQSKMKRLELSAYKPEETAQKLEILHKKQLQLNELNNALTLLNERREHVENAQKQQLETTLKWESEQAKLAELLPLLKPAKTKQEEYQRIYDQMELSVHDASKELRNLLKQGEPCPICGQRVEHLIPDEFFESQLKPLRKQLDDARKSTQNISANIQALQKNVANLQTLLNTHATVLEKSKAAFIKQEKQTQACIDRSGLSLTDPNRLSEIIQLEIDENTKLIAQITQQQNCINQCQQELNTLHTRYTMQQNNLQKAKEELTSARQQMEIWKTKVKTTEEDIQTFIRRIELFHQTHPTINAERLQALGQYKHDDIAKLKNRMEQLQQLENRLRGQAEQIEKLLQEQAGIRPDLSEEDTYQTLENQIATWKQQQAILQEQSGRDKALLESDLQQQSLAAKAKAKEECAHREWDKWNGLSTLFGDNVGKKFRNIAQSYLLSHLLQLANGYLQNFTERYTLTCVPGSLLILVEDTYQSGTPQSANILSGGESFMVSLSLALALSRLNATKSGVDTLFIDEGFGTLSADCLSSVMDTLERLHQLGGRRVGIISHVEELAERIPVQIRVSRINPTQSHVEIVKK